MMSKFSTENRKKLKKPNPGLGFTEALFVDGGQNAEIILIFKRHKHADIGISPGDNSLQINLLSIVFFIKVYNV